MARIKKGVIGGFSGKIGNIVGARWKDTDYIRSAAKPSKKEPSLKQLAQQAKFRMVNRFITSLNPLLTTSFNVDAGSKTPMNSAVSYTLKNAVGGSHPAFSILYPYVLVSRGDLPNILAPAVTPGTGGLLTFNWQDNSGMGIAKATDRMIVAAYCPASNQFIYSSGSSVRSALSAQLNLAAFSGQQVETYIGCISEDRHNVADSIYTGQVTL